MMYASRMTKSAALFTLVMVCKFNVHGFQVLEVQRLPKNRWVGDQFPNLRSVSFLHKASSEFEVIDPILHRLCELTMLKSISLHSVGKVREEGILALSRITTLTR